VTVRDFTNNPIAGSNVEFDFSACNPNDAHVCDVALGGGTPTCAVVNGKVLAQTNGAGQVTVMVFGAGADPGPAGGVPASGSGTGTGATAINCVVVRADGVDLGSAEIFAYDQNGAPPRNQPGNTGVDSSIISGNVTLAGLGMTRYRSDISGDGSVNGVDNSVASGVATLSALGTGFNNGCRAAGGAPASYCP
jgi:hypothetical protein